MEIKINKNNEIEYHFKNQLENEYVDIACVALDIIRDNYENSGHCIWNLVDELDLTYQEAKNLLNCDTNNLECFISDLFNPNHNDNDYK